MIHPKQHILVLHGPNLNLLGMREPELYGSSTLAEIDKSLKQYAHQQDVMVDTLQSNAEHVLIDAIHQAKGKYDIIVINAAAFTHTSIALRDALLGVQIPFIEVHLSNLYKREPFRQHSYLADSAVGVISGFGALSYTLALEAAIQHIQ